MFNNELRNAAEELLQYWNGKENIRILHTKPDSLIYKKSIEHLMFIMMGAFWKNCALNDDFLTYHNITEEELVKPYTPEEIKIIIDKHDWKCKNEYTEFFPRTFSDFCYNPRTRFSFFLVVSGDRKPMNMPEIPLDKSIVQEYCIDNTLNISDEIISAINFVINKYLYFYEQKGHRSGQKEYEEKLFFSLHRRFVREKLRDKEGFRPRWIASAWMDFVYWLKAENKNFYELYFK